MSGSRNFPSPTWQHGIQRIQCLLTTDCTVNQGYSDSPPPAGTNAFRHKRRMVPMLYYTERCDQCCHMGGRRVAYEDHFGVHQ